MKWMDLLATLLIFSIIVSVVIADEHAVEKEKCMKRSRSLLKGYMKLFNKCNKELGAMKQTPQQFQDSIGCIVKCTMKKTNVLDDNDLVTEELMAKSVESTFPEEYRKKAHEFFAKCTALHDLLDPKDPHCKSYLTLGTCMQEAIVDLCGEAPMI